MFAKNMGQTDRIIRAILGIALVLVFFSTTSGLGWLALVIGAVLLITAALGTCPPYSLLGINTCKVKTK